MCHIKASHKIRHLLSNRETVEMV